MYAVLCARRRNARASTQVQPTNSYSRQFPAPARAFKLSYGSMKTRLARLLVSHRPLAKPNAAAERRAVRRLRRRPDDEGSAGPPQRSSTAAPAAGPGDKHRSTRAAQTLRCDSKTMPDIPEKYKTLREITEAIAKADDEIIEQYQTSTQRAKEVWPRCIAREEFADAKSLGSGKQKERRRIF